MTGATVVVVGVVEGQPVSEVARADLDRADLVFGSARLLAAGSGRWGTGATEVLPSPDELARRVETRPDRRVAVLASGDPGFFGIVRVLAARLGRHRLRVHPAPSSVALAFARLGLPWDDAVVVSAHGRPLADAVAALAAGRAGADGSPAKAAVLVAPDQPPQALGQALVRAGMAYEHVAVCARLGCADEAVTETDLSGLAAGDWDPLAVVVLWNGDGVASSPTLRFGRPAAQFAHRAGMITKDEVRAVVLSKLDLPATGVLWDLGAGSGSVALEAAALAPGLEVYAVERRPDDRARLSANAEALGVALTVVEGAAEDVVAELPPPDRVFVGGGGGPVIDLARAHLRPGGRVVVASATLQSALAAHARLGQLVEVTVNRAVPIGSAGVRLDAGNPVFVAWGPVDDGGPR